MNAPAPLTGVTVGRYRFKERIGGGATADVYRAIDTHLDRKVAIKAVKQSVLADPERTRLVLKEARIQACLEHAAIVRIYDLVHTDDQLFLVMRLVRGRSLDRLLRDRGGPLRVREALHYLAQVLRGVGHAHDHGVVHRDLKPHNIQVTPAGDALVMDFGIAQSTSDEGASHTDSTVAGSPAYMAPEQILGQYSDARGDIYALGIILYQLVSAHHPFEKARSVRDMLRMHVRSRPRPPSAHVDGLHDIIDAAILRALSKDPVDRFRSCAEFAQALALETGVDRSSPSDRRWDPRVDHRSQVQIATAGGLAYIRGTMRDISAGGMSLIAEQRLRPGGRVEVLWSIDDDLDAPELRLDSVVSWCRPDGGGRDHVSGLEFVDLDERTRRRIADFVRDLLVLDKE